jgi:hypothetical protein
MTRTMSGTLLIYVFCILSVGGALAADATKLPPLKTATEILANKQTLQGKDYRILGYIRFDRPSRRAFLHRNLRELHKRDYKKTIFLGLRAKDFANRNINDGEHVMVTGYLATSMRGPLGVYPAHVIVDKIAVDPKRISNAINADAQT